MSSALFQCISEEVALNMERCLAVAPVTITGFKAFRTMACILFDGECGDMYWWCMNIAHQLPGTVSFIGVDEEAICASDKYKVWMLSTQPVGPIRNEEQRRYYDILVKSFMRYIRRIEFNSGQLNEICSQCVLGETTLNRYSDTNVASRIMTCMKSGLSCDYKEVLSTMNSDCYSSRSQNTLVRAMAHICYLGESLVRNDTSLGGRANRLMQSIFRVTSPRW